MALKVHAVIDNTLAAVGTSTGITISVMIATSHTVMSAIRLDQTDIVSVAIAHGVGRRSLAVVI